MDNALSEIFQQALARVPVDLANIDYIIGMVTNLRNQYENDVAKCEVLDQVLDNIHFILLDPESRDLH